MFTTVVRDIALHELAWHRGDCIYIIPQPANLIISLWLPIREAKLSLNVFKRACRILRLRP